MIDDLPDTNIKSVKYDKGTFSEEKIFVNKIDYYFSNAISRASKTMAECRSEKIKTKRTGTEG